jgi:HK97 family phage prohead protease
MKSTKKKPDVRLEGRLKAYKSGDKTLVIEGFANKAVVDRGNDLIDPGAWTKDGGLDSFMKNPTILFDHGMDPNVGGLPIGKAVEVTAKDDGLFIRAKISQAKDPPISVIRTLIEEQNLRAFSVGFNPGEMEPNDKGVNVIKSAELFEVSVVGIPMNQESLFTMESKNGKKLMTKSIDQIGAMICEDKGAEFAAMAHHAIDQLIESGKSRTNILDDLAEKCGISDTAILDILAGNFDQVPDSVVEGFKSVLGENFLEKADGGKEDEDDDPEGDDEDKSGEAEDEKADDSDDEGDDDEDADGGDDSEKSGDESPEGKFIASVNEKIAELIADGKSADDAVSEAIMAVNDAAEEKTTPTREMYETFFSNADKSAEDLETKQSEQGGDVEEDETGTPVQTAPTEDEFGSPMLDQMKQTNVLLGTLIKEMQLQTAQLKSMSVTTVGNSSENVDNQGTMDSDESVDNEKALRDRVNEQIKFVDQMNDRLMKFKV